MVNFKLFCYSLVILNCIILYPAFVSAQTGGDTLYVIPIFQFDGENWNNERGKESFREVIKNSLSKKSNLIKLANTKGIDSIISSIYNAETEVQGRIKKINQRFGMNKLKDFPTTHFFEFRLEDKDEQSYKYPISLSVSDARENSSGEAIQVLAAATDEGKFLFDDISDSLGSIVNKSLITKEIYSLPLIKSDKDWLNEIIRAFDSANVNESNNYKIDTKVDTVKLKLALEVLREFHLNYKNNKTKNLLPKDKLNEVIFPYIQLLFKKD